METTMDDFLDAAKIYKHLRKSEAKRRPSMDFIETVQNEISDTMRATLVDWLVQVADFFKLESSTLFLAVNYIDRYLSVKSIQKGRLQLLSVTCTMIASKYEEGENAPEVIRWCDVTANAYSEEEVLQMEWDVLENLNFEMTAPTTMCFLPWFCAVAEQSSKEAPLPVQFESLASFIAELSLVEYDMVCYCPSMIAASAVFLAKYMLSPSNKPPWNSALRNFTLYRASDMRDCVEALHWLYRCSYGSHPLAVTVKYCQPEHKFVGNKYCPPAIPANFFEDLTN